MAKKFDEHRSFLQNILDMQKKHLSEIELRADELKDHIKIVEDSLAALNVYEHIYPGKDPGKDPGKVFEPVEPVEPEVM